jgi:hypothetical protein
VNPEGLNPSTSTRELQRTPHQVEKP